MQEETATSFRLSPQQEQLWAGVDGEPTGGAAILLATDGDVDEARLRGALEQACERHEILRTTFPRRPGFRTPLQAVHERLAPEWSTDDLRELPAAERDAALRQFVEAEAERAWDLAEGPLVAGRLVQVDDERAALVLSIAAPCADAASAVTLAREVLAHYDGGSVEEEPLQYADFAEWQNDLLASEDDEGAAGRAYWEELTGARAGKAAGLPFLDAPSPSASRTVDVPLEPAAATSLSAAAERYGVSLDHAVQAAWHVVVARLNGADAAVVATVPPRRFHAELDTAIGLFARTLSVHSEVGEGVVFPELMVQLARAETEAERHGDYAPVAAPSAAGFVAAPELAVDGWSLLDLSAPASVPVAAELLQLETGPAVHLRFGAALDAELAARVATYLGRVLAQAAARPEVATAELELLADEDVRRLTAVPAEAEVPVLVHEAFAAAVAASPQHVAVVDAAGSVDYAELDARSNRLAHRLQAAGVGPDTVVGLCTDRSVDMVTAVLGILKAGGAYLPLNFEHPAARLRHQLTESQAVAVVAQRQLVERLPDVDGAVVCVDEDDAAGDASPLEVNVTGDNLAYVMYTSGSTGTPKGVAVTHGNLADYVQAIGERLGAANEPLSFGMVTAISTDLGNTAFFPALAFGGTLVLVPPAIAADAAGAAAFLDEHPVDVMKITPSHLNALLAGGDARVLPRRWLVTGGEALSWDIVARVRELAGCAILNHYGPTETTIGSCSFVVPEGPGPYAPATVPIGTPLGRTSCYVLDASGRLVPEGVPGELAIGGAGVARGYVGRDDLTAERFLADPYGPAGARMYATGDVVRRLPGGELEFMGRRDDQVKIRGFRVEPAEVEATLRTHPAVRQAAVLARDDGRGEPRLVAYVTGDSVAEDVLRRHVAEQVPDFMVPSAFVRLESLPLTPSGKLDRLALPAPEEAAGAGAYVAPRTPVEEAVAAIWSSVLGIERISVEEDFFALGGHSLLAAQIIAQVRSDLSVDLPLHALFSSPTIALLSEQIVGLIGESGDDETERLLAELEGLSDEEARRLLADEAEADV